MKKWNECVSIKMKPDSLISYVSMAFIAMSGAAYVNFLPGVVTALAGGLGFDEAQAGRIVAANGYGGIAGTVGAVFLIGRVRWRTAILMFTCILALTDSATVWFDSYTWLLGWRFFSGFVGGLSVGIAFSVLARMQNPDRAFGFLLFVQFCVGSLIIYILPLLEAEYGSGTVFFIMAALALICLPLLILVPSVSDSSVSSAGTSTLLWPRSAWLVLMALLSYLIAASGIWAYAGLIGLDAGFDAVSVGVYVAITGLTGLAGALIPVIRSGHRDRLIWVSVGVFFSIVSAVLMNFSSMIYAYLLSMTLLFFFWPTVQSFLLGLTAELDESGQLSTLASVVSFLGLASGPLLASSLFEQGGYTTVLYVSATIFMMSFLLLLKPLGFIGRTRGRSAVT